MSERLPATVTASLALHAAAIAGAAFLFRAGPREAARVVEGVDLIVSSPRRAAAGAEPAVKPPPLSTLDFLKLALPTVPRAAPVDVDAHIERHAAALAEPKLQDAARRDLAPKLAALDLSRRSTARNAVHPAAAAEIRTAITAANADIADSKG